MMQLLMEWIIFLMVNLSLSVTATGSVLICINSTMDQSNCSPTSLNETSCGDIIVTEYTNLTSFSCPELDTALDYVTTPANNFSFAHIFLPSGNFTLRKSWSVYINLTLTGNTKKNSIIQCDDYDSKQDTGIASTADELKYTLFFHNVRYVRLEYLQFDSCPQPMRMEANYNVSILNCVFTNFKEAVLDIYNSIHVTIANSNFSNNSGTGNVLLPFRGNAGAVAIAYNKNQSTSLANSNISVENCLFTDNQANVSAESFLTSSNIVRQGVFNGRGGGLALLINDSFHNITASVNNCQFVNNFASSFGGGFYTVFDGRGTQHMLTVKNSQFINNAGTLGSGGLNVAYITNGEFNYPITTLIQNCYFFENQGEIGGAIYIFPASTFGGDGNVAFIENSTFENNRASIIGGAIAAATYSLFRAKELLPLYRIFNRSVYHIDSLVYTSPILLAQCSYHDMISL